MNCPNCGASPDKGVITYSWGTICHRCGYGTNAWKAQRRNLVLREKMRNVFISVLLAAVAILNLIGVAYGMPGYPSAMFHTEKVAKIALVEQNKILHSILHSLFPK